jgi:serine/threonine-protein kinase
VPHSSVESVEVVPDFPVPVSPGQVIGDRYVIGSVIGEGGMGVVCAATHLHLGTKVAVKLIRADLQHDPDAIVRFRNEARAAAALKGEHIARVYDFGQLDSGQPYLVMEHLEGIGLDMFLAERGPLAQSEAADIVLQACEGLAEAHAVSLVHRDIKAANLFLARRPDGQFVLKILDFGIAKRLVDGAYRGVTNPKTSLGSPWYMPPEQMMAPNTVDQRADVWSLGVLLYELLTQEYPFNGDTVVQVCANVLTAPTPSLRALRPDLDAGLETVVGRCLEKKMEHRFDGVVALADALRPFSSRAAPPASDLAPSEGLNLEAPSEDVAIEVEVPLEDSPVMPLSHAAGARENATVESYAPMTVHRHRRLQKRQPAGGAHRKQSAGWLIATAFIALLLGVGLSWLGLPYLQARYGALNWRQLERQLANVRLPFDPILNPSPAATPLERELRAPELMISWSSVEAPAISSSAASTANGADPPPALTPEEIRGRAERYERWLREQGMTRLNGEWTADDSNAPPRRDPKD